MKILLIPLMIIVGGVCAMSQNLEGGLVAKGGFSQILRASEFGQSQDYDYTNKFRFSYQGGIYGAFNFSPRSGVGLELLYLRQNGLLEISFNTVDSITNTPIAGTDNLYMYVGYLSLPVYYSFTAANVSIHLGGQGNLTLYQKGKEVFDATTSSGEVHNETTFDSLNFKNYDAGLCAGIRYKSNKRIFFGFDYYLGFVNLSNDEATFSAQNQNFSFFVGFRILSGSTRSEREQWYTE